MLKIVILKGDEIHSDTSRKAKQKSNKSQIEKQDKKNDIEMGSEFQIGNSSSQSQKKSGRQMNKKPGS